MKRILGYKIKTAVKPWQISLGLMFRWPIFPLLFVMPKETKKSFHTFFCKPMAILFFDINGKIVEKYWDVRPWRVIKPLKPYRYVLELPLNHPLTTLEVMPI